MKRLVLAAAIGATVLLGATPAYALTATKFTSSINTHVVTYDAPAVMGGTLRTTSGKALAGKTVYLLRNGSRVATYKTDTKGNLSKKVKFAGHAHWQWKFSGDSSYKVAFSPTQYSDAKKIYSGSIADITDPDPAYTSPQVDPDTGVTTYIFVKSGIKLTAGHQYQVMTNGHLANYMFGHNDLGPQVSSLDSVSSFAFKATKTGNHMGFWFVSDDTDAAADDSLALYIW